MCSCLNDRCFASLYSASCLVELPSSTLLSRYIRFICDWSFELKNDWEVSFSSGAVFGDARGVWCLWKLLLRLETFLLVRGLKFCGVNGDADLGLDLDRDLERLSSKLSGSSKMVDIMPPFAGPVASCARFESGSSSCYISYLFCSMIYWLFLLILGLKS